VDGLWKTRRPLLPHLANAADPRERGAGEEGIADTAVAANLPAAAANRLLATANPTLAIAITSFHTLQRTPKISCHISFKNSSCSFCTINTIFSSLIIPVLLNPYLCDLAELKKEKKYYRCFIFYCLLLLLFLIFILRKYKSISWSYSWPYKV